MKTKRRGEKTCSKAAGAAFSSPAATLRPQHRAAGYICSSLTFWCSTGCSIGAMVHGSVLWAAREQRRHTHTSQSCHDTRKALILVILKCLLPSNPEMSSCIISTLSWHHQRIYSQWEVKPVHTWYWGEEIGGNMQTFGSGCGLWQLMA